MISALRVEQHEPVPIGVYIQVPDRTIIHIHRVTDM